MQTNERLLEGILVPLVTPLTLREELDVSALERLVEHVLAGGVHGIFLLGTTGEGPSLAPEMKRDVVERALALVAGRVPVVVAISDTSFDASVQLGRFAGEHGAAAVAATPPFYFPLEQDAVADWFEELADRLPVPLFLYNFPALTKITLAHDTVRRLMDHSNIAGIKDSSGDLEYFAGLCRLTRIRSDWSVFIGPEEKLIDAMRMGAHGGICGGANVHPHLYADLFAAGRAGDEPAIGDLQREVGRVANLLYPPARDCAGVIRGIKSALAQLGICTPVTSLPLRGGFGSTASASDVVAVGVVSRPD